MGKHTLLLSRMFSFKNQNRSKTQSVLTGAGREEVLAGCMCAIFGLTHGRRVSWSLLRMPAHHRRLPARRASGWQTLSTRAGWRQWIERWKHKQTPLGPCSRRREEQWGRLLQDVSELFLRKRGKALLQTEYLRVALFFFPWLLFLLKFLGSS